MKIEQIAIDASDGMMLKVSPPFGLDDESEFIKALVPLVNKPLLIVDFRDIHLDEDSITVLVRARFSVKQAQPRTIVLVVVNHASYKKILRFQLNCQLGGVGYCFDNLEAAKEYCRHAA